MSPAFDVVTPEQSLALLPLALAFALLLVAGVVTDTRLVRLALREGPGLWRDRMQRLLARPWGWRGTAGACLLYLSTQEVLLLIARGLRHGAGADDQAVQGAVLLLQTVWVPVCLLMVAGVWLNRRRTSWREAFGGPPVPMPDLVRSAVRALVALVPPLALAALLTRFIMERLGIPEENQFVLRLLTDPSQPRWLRGSLCAAAVTIVPVIEELIFRGVLLPALSRIVRPSLAILTVSTLFAAAHLNLQSFLPIATLSVSLCISYIYTNTVIVPILMHAIFNATSLFVLFTLLRVTGQS